MTFGEQPLALQQARTKPALSLLLQIAPVEHCSLISAFAQANFQAIGQESR